MVVELPASKDDTVAGIFYKLPCQENNLNEIIYRQL